MFRLGLCLTLAALVSAGCTPSYHPASRDPGKTSDQGTTAPDPHSGLAGGGSFHGSNFHGMTAPGSAAEPEPVPFEGDADAPVNVGALQFTAPEGWTRQQPRSQFVQAEFTLPKAEGDERNGRLTVSIAGGSIDDNVNRWRGQFGEKPEKDAREEQDIAGLKVTVVDLAGTYNDQPGPFAPGVQREGYRMLAAIVPVDDQLHFIKAYGPAKTMAEHEDAFHAFLQSMKKP